MAGRGQGSSSGRRRQAPAPVESPRGKGELEQGSRALPRREPVAPHAPAEGTQEEEEAGKEEEDVDGGAEEGEEAVGGRTGPSATTKAQLLARFKQLSDKRKESVYANQRQVHKEHADAKTPKVSAAQLRKQEKARKLQEKLDTEGAGEDLERIKALEWSADDVARWKEREAAKEANAASPFTDYGQLAAKKYDKLIRKLTPTEVALHASQAPPVPEYAVPDSTPSVAARERLAQDMRAQDEARAKFSRRRAFHEAEEVTYINERNMHFNKKVARAYDRATADIKASLERGTAL